MKFLQILYEVPESFLWERKLLEEHETSWIFQFVTDGHPSQQIKTTIQNSACLLSNNCTRMTYVQLSVFTYSIPPNLRGTALKQTLGSGPISLNVKDKVALFCCSRHTPSMKKKEKKANMHVQRESMALGTMHNSIIKKTTAKTLRRTFIPSTLRSDS